MPTKVVSGLQHMGCKERLRKLDLLSLGNGSGSDFSLSKVKVDTSQRLTVKGQEVADAGYNKGNNL